MFLGRLIQEVMRSTINLETAIHLYEKKRIPRAWHKQQSAFTQGQLLSARGQERTIRDNSTKVEVQSWDHSPVHPRILPATYRSFLLFSSPFSVPSILYYDAESDADFAVDEWLMNHNDIDQKTYVSGKLRQKWWSGLHDNGVQIAERASKSTAKL